MFELPAVFRLDVREAVKIRTKAAERDLPSASHSVDTVSFLFLNKTPRVKHNNRSLVKSSAHALWHFRSFMPQEVGRCSLPALVLLLSAFMAEGDVDFLFLEAETTLSFMLSWYLCEEQNSPNMDSGISDPLIPAVWIHI